MKDKLGNICIILGTVLALAALSLFAYNRWEENEAEKRAQNVLPALIDEVRRASDENEAKVDISEEGEDKPQSDEMTVVEIDGYGYVGYLSISKLGLDLPVLSEWDYTRLKIAPCRYFGSSKTDNLVVAAHNYARHFGSLKELTVGDEIVFTDMDGTVSVYEVSQTKDLSPTAIEEMSAGEYALTLFTCNYSGQARVTVQCDRVSKG